MRLCGRKLIKVSFIALFLFFTISIPLQGENNLEILHPEKKAAIIFDTSRTLFYLITGAWGGIALIDISFEFQLSLSTTISYFVQAEGMLTYPFTYGVSTGLYIMPQGKRLKGWFIRTGFLAYYQYLWFTSHPAITGSDYSITTIGGELTIGYQFIWDSGFMLSSGIGARVGYDNGHWILWPGIELARIGLRGRLFHVKHQLGSQISLLQS